jgi:hypothetical protein
VKSKSIRPFEAPSVVVWRWLPEEPAPDGAESVRGRVLRDTHRISPSFESLVSLFSGLLGNVNAMLSG